MALTLHFHPLSSFCEKALVGLYELEIPFDRVSAARPLLHAYIHLPMQKIVGDRRRPEGGHDPLGVEQARAQMETAYALADEQMREGPWALGGEFTMADCSALPALFYGERVAPFAARWPNLAGYFQRLKARPSAARVLEEAEPYMKMFPG